MDLNLKDKIVIVTGAGRGIGRTTALTFCREGASVVIDDIDLEAAKLVEEEAKATGAQALAIRADVTKIDEVRQMVKETLDKFGRIDVLVNNVGILYFQGRPVPLKAFEETTEDDWPSLIDVTLTGVLNCSKAVIETMKRQKSGSIINITSYAATSPRGTKSTIYGAGKGGIISFTKNLAYELGPYGIRANCVSPGPTKVSRPKPIGSENEDPAEAAKLREAREAEIKQQPLGRGAIPQEIANSIVFLASDASSYTTGQTLNVNGGLYMA